MRVTAESSREPTENWRNASGKMTRDKPRALVGSLDVNPRSSRRSAWSSFQRRAKRMKRRVTKGKAGNTVPNVSTSLPLSS